MITVMCRSRVKAVQSRACCGCLTAALLMALSGVAAGQTAPGEVLLMNTPRDALIQAVEQRLSDVVNLLETGDLSPLAGHFTSEGWTMAAELLENVPMRNAWAVHETRLAKLPGKDEYEVRDIRVQVEMGEVAGNPYQSLVFTLDAQGRIAALRFAMERHFYQDLVRQGEQLQDFAQRQQIIQFVELFRTAYNRKDLEYLLQVFSDDALIIVGRVLKNDSALPGQEKRLESSLLSQDQVEFIQYSKDQYLAALDRVFQRNQVIHVGFDSLRVMRNQNDSALYGVTLKQRWTSSTYTDTGYVFLLMDFVDPDFPLIHVRSWQPNRFADGSLVSLGHFEVIRMPADR